ncbi:PadR family transcriptional regulator [Nocardiopsis lambiniae]|uniref:PadR family transcriptional regulator n=1 Tax=Nocardiopsis lambiniae TaxID=3075539 RepID=A0ABU2M7T7_9ACTN|nr:PadR family transcriptional regulator [Nocardiopsis sp. DSM 44743]MDT0328725.1 PadR family transcriptional regulator [Nocardiopsis sp. DSM 44743]
MSAIRLLVLGVVRLHGRAHGYQVRNDLEFWGAHEWSNAKPGSIYHALKQMAKQGLLIAHDVAPSTVGGPPRTEYEITPRGAEEYFALLRRSLSEHDARRDMLSAGLGFMADLPREEVLDLLSKREEGLRTWQDSVSTHYLPEEHAEQMGHIGEIMEMWLHMAKAETLWTRRLMERIESGAHTFAGEAGEPFAEVFAEDHPDLMAAWRIGES